MRQGKKELINIKLAVIQSYKFGIHWVWEFGRDRPKYLKKKLKCYLENEYHGKMFPIRIQRKVLKYNRVKIIHNIHLNTCLLKVKRSEKFKL